MKINSVKFLFANILLLCTTSVMAQSGYTTSKIIEVDSSIEVKDTLRMTNKRGESFLLPKSDVTTSVSVDRSTNRIRIKNGTDSTLAQEIDDDVVIININGISIVQKSTTSVSTSTSSSSVSSGGRGRSAESSVRTTTASSSTSSSASSEASSVAVTDVAATQTVEESQSSVSTSSTSRTFEVTVGASIGCILYEDPKFVMSAGMRALMQIKSNVRVGLSVSCDKYILPFGSVSILDVMAAVDVSMWDEASYSAFLPARFTADMGGGFGIGNSDGFGGFVMVPGLLWHIKDYDSGSKLCFTTAYKFQCLYAGCYATSINFGVGYKF